MKERRLVKVHGGYHVRLVAHKTGAPVAMRPFQGRSNSRPVLSAIRMR